MAEMACDTIDIELKDESDAVYYAQSEAYDEATESVNKDPRHSDSFESHGRWEVTTS